MSGETKSDDAYSILDSKHIVTTKLSLYDVKIVKCGEYIQVYAYKNKRTTKKKIQGLNDLNLKKNSDIVNSVKINATKNQPLLEEHKIEDRSIIRSKLECQRIAKSNMKDWQTFITLTFEENITNVVYANKRFRYFIDKVKRVNKDFKYLCIPEFQKRGAVHYHLLTNISIDDNKLIYSQEDNPKFKHIKYWSDGFTSVEVMKGNPKKVVGYISKYMTKDIDNRLFNRHRYFYSRNLTIPNTKYLDLENKKDLEVFKKIIRRTDLIYHNEYVNPYDNNEVLFDEYLKKINDEEYLLREKAFLNKK